MTIQISIQNVEQLDTGLWRTRLSKEDVMSFSSTPIPVSAYGVILVENPKFDSGEKLLSTPLGMLEVLAIGVKGKTILIQKTAPNGFLEELMVGIQNNSKKREKGVGIEAFIESCRSFDLPIELVNSITELLETVSSKLSFTLREGEQRKWTAEPNFVALTIQNRNKQLLVSVKGDPRRMGYQTIDPKVSRPPYCEFHVNSPDQYEDTLSAIVRSANH